MKKQAISTRPANSAFKKEGGPRKHGKRGGDPLSREGGKRKKVSRQGRRAIGREKEFRVVQCANIPVIAGERKKKVSEAIWGEKYSRDGGVHEKVGGEDAQLWGGKPAPAWNFLGEAVPSGCTGAKARNRSLKKREGPKTTPRGGHHVGRDD